jgi:hypothetical protein
MADVIGSAEFEIRATTRQLQSDLAAAERQTKAELKKVEAAALDAQRELRRAFSDVGQTEFERAMKVIRNASDHTEDEVRAAANRVAADLKGRYRDLGADIGRTLMGVSQTAQVAFAAVTAYSLKLASDAGEIESAFGVAFGSATADAKAFSDTLSDEVGRDAVVLREQMTRLQLVLTGTGVAAQTSAEMVKMLTTAGVDAGSLFNTSDAAALQKIISGLTGETEPLKAFGVVISQAAVEAELLRLGFKGTASEASEAAKTIARTNLIIKGLAVAQGDAARTSDSAANTTKRMTAEFNKAARDLGTELLPAMVQVFGAATNVIKAFNDLPGGVQVAGLAFLGLIAAGGPIAGLLANLGRVITLAKETRNALIAASLAGGAGGAAARAAGGGALAGLGLTGVAVAGVVSVAGDTPNAPLQGQARVNAQLQAEAETRARIVRLTREGNTEEAARQQAYLNRVSARRVAETQAAAATAAASPAVPPVDTSVTGGFALPPSLQTGTGTGGRRRGAAGPTAAEVALIREALELQNELDVARARGDERAVRALEDRQSIARLTADFERAGYTDAAQRAEDQVASLNEARTQAENLAKWVAKSDEFWESIGENAEKAADAAALLTDQTLDRLGYELELARIGGSEGAIKDAERRLFIETRMLEILRLKLAASEAEARIMAGGEFNTLNAATEGREMAEGIVSLLRSDNIWEEAGRRFKDAAFDGIEQLLSQLFSGMNGGGKDGGGGGWIANVVGAVLGKVPGFAGGVENFGGGLAYVHGGEVLMNLSKGTSVIPAAAVKGMGGGSTRVVIEVNDDRFNAYVDGRAGPMAVQAAATAYGAGRSDMATAQRRSRQRFV